MPTPVHQFITLEDQIIQATIASLLEAGFALSVNNGGEDDEIEPTTEYMVVANAMKATDEDWLQVHRIVDGKIDADRSGWVRFIYGNEDYEVINDYTTNLDLIMAPINDAIDKATRQ